MPVYHIGAATMLSEFHRVAGCRIVLCHGAFDPLHAGHIDHLRRAAKRGGALYVSVTGDAFVRKGAGRPIMDQQSRAEAVAALRFVDAVLICEHETAVPIIDLIEPDVYCKGGDYKDRDAAGNLAAERAAVEKNGGVFEVIASGLQLSATEIAANLQPSSAELRAFLATVSKAEVFEALEKTEGSNAVVIGEHIEDVYVTALPLSRSPKEYVMCVLEAGTARYAGGAYAIAAMLESIHRAKVALVASPPGMVVKTRFLTYANQKLFELYRMEAKEFTGEALSKAVYLAIDEGAWLLVADFGHGYIPVAAAASIPPALWTAVVVQANSANWGFNLIQKYPRFDYLVCDEPEARLALQRPEGEIAFLLHILGEHAPRPPMIACTMGRQGCAVVDSQGDVVTAPAFNPRPLDTIGAGDAFLAATAPLVRLKANARTIACVGSAAAAIKCSIRGHERTVQRAELMKYLETLLL